METFTMIPVLGEKLIVAANRLEYVCSMIDKRLLVPEGSPVPPWWAQRPAFEVHIESGFADLVRDRDCRLCLRHIVVLGERARVVVFYHEETEAVAAAVSGMDALSAALMAGRVLRRWSS